METETVEVTPVVKTKMDIYMDAITKEVITTLVGVLVIQGVTLLGKAIAVQYKRRKMHIVTEVTHLTPEA